MSKNNTQKIERKHLIFRTRLKRLARKTICFSKSLRMHKIMIGLLINVLEFWVCTFLGHNPKLHTNSVLPKKSSKNRPLSTQDRKQNRNISKKRIAIEHVISLVKRFRILSERYRNRRKRFSLRFSLIAGICNFEQLS